MRRTGDPAAKPQGRVPKGWSERCRAAAPSILTASTALLTALSAGCPPAGPKTPGGGDPAPVASSSAQGPGSGTATGGPVAKPDPLAGSIFTRAQVLAIYTAEVHGGAERDAALREHRLIDARGAEVPTRARAYERAIQALAEQDPEGWAAFVESLRVEPTAR